MLSFATALKTCTDSDGGTNSLLKGTTNGYTYEEEYSTQAQDSCYDNNVGKVYSCTGQDCFISENYCDGYYVAEDLITCPNGCNAGACLFASPTPTPTPPAKTCLDFGYEKGTVGNSCNSQNTSYDLSKCYNATTSCKDHDGGKNYYTASNASSSSSLTSGNPCSGASSGGGGGGAIALDHCNNSILTEMICVNNAIATDTYTCPNRCYNGACILGTTATCVDSDEVVETKEISVGASENIATGINVKVESTSITTLGFAAKLIILKEGSSISQEIILSSLENNATIGISQGNIEYTLSLISVSDTSATIKTSNYLNYYVKGTASKEGKGDTTDFCVDTTKLSEALCNNEGNPAYTQYNCQNGCVNGICLISPIPPVQELCEAVYLDTATNKIYLGDNLNKAKTVLTKSKLSGILASGAFTGNVYIQYVQDIIIGSYPKITKEKQSTGADAEQIGVKLSPSLSNYLYNATITFSKTVDFTDKDLIGEEITLFGESFIISPETGTSNLESLILLRNAVKVVLSNKNPLESITIAGNKYTLELISATDSSSTIKLTNSAGNDISREINEGSSKNMLDLIVTVINAEGSNLAFSTTLIIATDRIRLGNEEEVLTGLTESVIDGTYTKIEGGLTAANRITISVSAPDSDRDAILIGGEFIDPVFNTFKFTFDSYDDINGAKIRVGGCTKEKPLSCTPKYTCRIEPTRCPSTGIQIKKCEDLICKTNPTEEEITCIPNECTGCEVAGKCIPYGYRMITTEDEPSYCDIDGLIKEQKIKDTEGSWAKCQNNYECDSNLCSGGECVEINDAIKEASSFKGLFIRVFCRLAHIFSEENYNVCIGNYLGYSPALDDWSAM